MSYGIIILLLTIHFIADFVCQTDKMANNKSSSYWWLCTHIYWYSVVTYNALLVALFFKHGSVSNKVLRMCLLYTIANGTLHFATDWVTSRITKRLWAAQEVHYFFVVIGFDQLLHYTALFYIAFQLGLNGLF